MRPRNYFLLLIATTCLFSCAQPVAIETNTTASDSLVADSTSVDTAIVADTTK